MQIIVKITRTGDCYSASISCNRNQISDVSLSSLITKVEDHLDSVFSSVLSCRNYISVVYKLTAQSMIYYLREFMSVRAISKYTGINANQFWFYLNNTRTPRVCHYTLIKELFTEKYNYYQSQLITVA